MNSGSDDDWENNLDDDVLEKKTEVKTQEAFKQEDAYDSEEERKKLKAEEEERRKTQQTRVKQSNKKDLEKLYALKMEGKNNKEL